MTAEAAQINNFLTPSGRSAAEITHEIKSIGDGNMENGLLVIKNFFAEEQKIANTQHSLIGIGTVLIAGALITSGYYMRKKIKAHKVKGQIILKKISSSKTDTNSPTAEEQFHSATEEDEKVDSKAK